MPHTKNKPLPTSPYQGRSNNFPLIRGIKGVCLKSRHGFTLVELIVTITIIAILGTIAFTAFNGFQSSARDSTRASDLANLSQALDTSYIKTGSYPNPDNSFTVTYSGGSLWYQGTVGDTLINTLSSNGSKLSKKPTDPLVTTKEYTYSRSAYGNTYELSSNWEGDRIAYLPHQSLLVQLPHLTSPKIGEELAHFFSLPLFQGESEGVTSSLIPQAFAASGNPTITYIKGNYNGMVAKTVTGSTVYVIATPSLTTSTGTTGSNIDITTLSGKLLYHGQTNSGGIAYTPTLIYSSGSLPTNDNAGQITLLTTNLQTVYSGSVVSSNSNISNILTTTGATNITSLGASIITNYLGGSASAPPPPPATSYSLTNSLMFDSAGSQYLSKSFTTAGNRKKWTWSGWVKLGRLDTQRMLFSMSNGTTASSSSYTSLFFTTTNQLGFQDVIPTYVTQTDCITTSVFRDPSAFYHIVLSYDSAQSISSDRVKIWVNGKQQVLTTGVSGGPTYPGIQNTQTQLNAISNYNYLFSSSFPAGAYAYDGYVSDLNFVDSGALDPTAFGYTDPTTNQWLPKQYTGNYGTNGFHLDFSSGASVASLGTDSSGNGNTWTVNGVSAVANNQVIDTPLNNFATLNPIDWGGTLATLSKGNLKVTANAAVHEYIRGTQAFPKTGKWYWEALTNTTASSTSVHALGISTTSGLANAPSKSSIIYLNNYGQSTNQNFINFAGGGSINIQTVNAGYTQVSGDVLKFAFDADTNKFWIGVNNNWFSSVGTYSGDPANGMNPVQILPPDYDWTTITFPYGSQSETFNFGQGGQAGLIYSTGAAGYFKFQPPTGFKALSTANLPDPTIKNPKQYFDVLTYTGNNATQQSITGLGFQPDFAWIKNRTALNDHSLHDSVRGATKRLRSNQTYVENTEAMQSFDTNGFTVLGAGGVTNVDTNKYVAWNWKKGTTPGFDIVSYTGGGVNLTIPHSLNAIPKLIIIKERTSVSNWVVQHDSLGWTRGFLGISNVEATTSTAFSNNIAPTNSSFTVSTYSFGDNTNTRNYIAYLWSEVPGFSKFGSYTGNGSSDGPFVYTGFRPRYVMIKKIDTGTSEGWFIHDTMRDIYNPTQTYLTANSTYYDQILVTLDILSNGFKIKTLASYANTSGGTYIYAAFAEAPFKYANAR